MIRKAFSLLIVASIIFIAITQKTQFIETVKNGGDAAIVMSIMFMALLVFIPLIPAIVAAGIIGSIFGTWEGTTLSLTGAMLGTMLMFFLTRFGFSTWAQHLIGRYPKAKQYEFQFEHHAFFTVFVSRLIPIIPTTLVNILAGMSRISWISFFFASLFGKLPVYFLYTFAGKEMSTHQGFSFLLYGMYFLVVAIATGIYVMQQRRKRLKDALS